MKKRVLVAILLLAVIFGSIFLLRRNEPTYRDVKFSYWLDHLTTTSPHYSEACEAIRQIGPDGIPWIIRSLNASESKLQKAYRENWPMIPSGLQRRLQAPRNPIDTRIKAARALELLGPRARSAEPAVLNTLQHSNVPVRIASIGALGAIGSERSLPALIDLLGNPDRATRRAAGAALLERWNSLGQEPIEEFLKLIQRPQPFLRLGAAEWMLARDSSCRPSLEVTMNELLDALDPALRQAAAEAALKGSFPRDILTKAVAALIEHPEHGVRVKAFERASDLGITLEIIPILLNNLKESDTILRRAAAEALGYAETPTKEITTQLMARLDDTELMVQFAAVRSLEQLGFNNEALNSVLIQSLQKQPPDLFAAHAIIAVGNRRLAGAVPGLLAIVIGQTNDQKWIIPPQIEPRVRDRDPIKDPENFQEKQNRLNALVSLGKIGPPAREAADELTKLLNASVAAVRIHAAAALVRINPDKSDDATAVLAATVNSTELSHLRAIAAETLARFGKRTPDLDASARALLHESDTARLIAAAALWQMNPDEHDALELLIEPFRGSNYLALAAAAEILADLGPRASAAIPELIRAQGHTNKNVRLLARKALRAIRGAPERELP